MTSQEIRQKFLTFFEKRNHAILKSAPVVTSDEKSVTDSTLFNTAGMQPLIPYLLGETHPAGKRLASSQKCVRTTDIDEVGDNTHLTFFEMLGNWSLGDYFKEDAIKWSYEFLTNKEEGLGLDPNRLYVTVFEGDENAPRDEEAFNIWKEIIPENRIYFMSADSNWWEAGDNGPCGPDSEMYYDVTGELGDLDKDNFIKADDEQKVVEIWNDVFMQFEKKDGKIVGKLPNHAVDTGAGLERLVTVVNNKNSVSETDIFVDTINFIKENASEYNEHAARIIADHVKASTFMIAEGVLPANTDRGYILRRLIRRAIVLADKINLPQNIFPEISKLVTEKYTDLYTELKNTDQIEKAFTDEETKFRKTLDKGNKILEKKFAEAGKLDGKTLFELHTTYGFPKELSIELIKSLNGEITDTAEDEFNVLITEHQKISKTAAEGKFKGGLSGDSETEKKYHTATHLLHQALRDILGDHVQQKGSNINEDRLRFDFSHDSKMTDEEKQKVEQIINEKISAAIPVNQVTLPSEEAEKTGALHFFGDKYGDEISIYYIGDSLENAYSKEYCGGPHVKNTSEIGQIKIKKEEASSAGVRRIKIVLV
jgi:alanyl-tRNA synthetase